MDTPPIQPSMETPWKKAGRFLFGHVVEVLLLSGLFLLLITAVMPTYERFRLRSQISLSYNNLQELVEALMVYSHEQPVSRVFPPQPDYLFPGVSLCPISEPYPAHLAFLTTPIPYLENVPHDPFISRIVEKQPSLTPFVAHWIRAGMGQSSTPHDYANIGWGAFSIGPALKLPPQYSITVLRKVPYESLPLRKNLYHSSNGLTSVGLIYLDSLGNRSPVKSEM